MPPTPRPAGRVQGAEFTDIPAPVLRRAEDLFLDWFASALAGKGARPVEIITRFMRRHGAGPTGPAEILITAAAAARWWRHGQCRGLALRRAGRRAQRLGVPPGGGGVPAGAGGGPGAGRQRARSADGLRGGLRGRHPRRRVPRPLALPHLPHHRHGGHPGRRRRGGPPAALDAGTDAPRLRFGRHPSAGLWEFLRDAADSKQLHTAHAAGAGLTAAYLAADGFTGARPSSRAAGAGGRHVHRRRSRQAGTDGLGTSLGAGRDLVQVPRLLPPHPPRGRRAAAADAGAPHRQRRAWPRS
jgi:hypothetical protein